MRITVAPQTGHPVPQFIVHAEGETDQAILHAFTEYARRAEVTFWLHGPTFTNGRCVAFNFGYIQARPTLIQRIIRAISRR